MIAGVDEAGRGPLAGPVVSAAVILPHDFFCEGINDSKKLSEKKRDALFPRIMEKAIAVSTGLASHHEIDDINILRASLLSMKRAVENLSSLPGSPVPDFLLIDGKFTLDMDIHQSAIVQGDSKSISIAAASIIAKDHETLCFIEVKTRSSIKKGLPKESVTPSKQNKIILGASFYLKKNRMLESRIRFDVIEVFEKKGRFEFNLIKNAFQAG